MSYQVFHGCMGYAERTRNPSKKQKDLRSKVAVILTCKKGKIKLESDLLKVPMGKQNSELWFPEVQAHTQLAGSDSLLKDTV